MKPATLRDRCDNEHDVIVTIDEHGGVRISCDCVDDKGRICERCMRKGETMARQYKAGKLQAQPLAAS